MLEKKAWPWARTAHLAYMYGIGLTYTGQAAQHMAAVAALTYAERSSLGGARSQHDDAAPTARPGVAQHEHE